MKHGRWFLGIPEGADTHGKRRGYDERNKESMIIMKVKKPETSITDFRVWCEGCCIRIAPHEERTVVESKSYHPRCYSKLPLPKGKQKGSVSQASVVPGRLLP